jgi:hypothetical protein
LYLTDSKIHIRKYFPDALPVQNVLKQGDALLLLRFNIILEYAIRKVQGNKDKFKLNEIHQGVRNMAGRSSNPVSICSIPKKTTYCNQ